jgi:hypothetical protein
MRIEVILCAFFVTFFIGLRIISHNFKINTMKKILTIMIFSMLSVLASAQIKLWFNKISETEINPDYNGGINTMEGYVRPFIDTCGITEYNKVIGLLGSGEIDKYMQYLNDLGERRFVREANEIKSMLWNINKSKLYFISNDKLYVVTYDVTDHKSLYLFRRDDDGWKPASDLIAVDDYQFKEYMKRFESRTTRWNATDTLYTLENQFYGEVRKISNGSVFVTFSTEIWYPKESNTYNSIAIFVPDTITKETYHVSLFEPENKAGKAVKNVTSYYCTWSKDFKPIWHKTIGTVKYPILYGTRNTDYMEFTDGNTFKITYWDGSRENPRMTGTINFKIVDYSAFIDAVGTTIVLNKLK